ncbi:MAG: chitobiase/beta-hexosaminidase C-terminal domain-containing protein [Acidobacteriaceae bacterium]
MRKTIGVLVVMVALGMGARLASAQMMDPSTGMMVDPSTDPIDYSDIMSGQPTNYGMEAALSASAQANADADANMATADASDDTQGPVAPPRPVTPKPVMTPNGGSFVGSVQVTIADSDGAAAVFYTTNGRKPTTSSQRYAGPIPVTAKTKVEALAFDVNMDPSGVVSKTYKVKATK